MNRSLRRICNYSLACGHWGRPLSTVREQQGYITKGLFINIDIGFIQPLKAVILSEAKDLKDRKRKILRFAQNDKDEVLDI